MPGIVRTRTRVRSRRGACARSRRFAAPPEPRCRHATRARNFRNDPRLTASARRPNHRPVIFTELPDLPPRPLTARNAQFRREFYRRWGRENAVISGSARYAEYAPLCQTLSIKCVARGTEDYFVDRRRITDSDDTWLVLNEGRTYSSVLDAPAGAYTFSIFFRPGLAREV